VISRAASPMPRIVRRQSPAPYVVERREYYDGPRSVVEERTVIRPSRSVSRASSRSIRLVEAPPSGRGSRREVSHSEEEIFARPAPRRPVFEEPDWYAARSRGRSHGRHECSRSRMSTYDDDGDDYPVRHLSVLAAPMPPPMNTSSLGYIEPHPHDSEVEVTRTKHHEAIDRRGRPAMVTRRRRSRSRSVAEPAATFLRPGDDITVVEKSNDYDTYDRDGMRVRVREI
jgi:hypothetical protein